MNDRSKADELAMVILFFFPFILISRGGHSQDISWGMWALAASVPGLVSLIAIPLVIYGQRRG